MTTTSFATRRSAIEEYFDRTALDAWKQLTSDAPVSKIRETVRAGRDRMRGMLLDWLPADLTGMRLLDAGCGTGALSFEAARRGAEVVGIDVSASLIEIARERIPEDIKHLTIDFRAGDMLNPACGRFDYVVAMDSLIHYETPDAVAAMTRLTQLATRGVLVTVAPRTKLLMTMFTVGKIFPKSNRRPAIVPVGIDRLRTALQAPSGPGGAGWQLGRTERVLSGFYTSQAVELIKP